MPTLSALTAYLDEQLASADWEDACPNGLQVAGRTNVQHLVGGVTACQALLDAAVQAEADAVLVHHGLFWQRDSRIVTGMLKARLQCLLNKQVSLISYHLPLDVHPEWGNNAVLARLLNLVDPKPFTPLLWHGCWPSPSTATQVATHIQQCLGRTPLHISGNVDLIHRVAWCTGAAQDLLPEAAALGVEAFISGEISERTVHQAREMGVHYFAAGHHATERGGVQALGQHLIEHFGLTFEFIDIDNPV